MNKMRHVGLVVLLFCSAAFLVNAQQTILDTTSQQVSLKFDCGDNYDWGKVKYKDSPLECSVKIINDGTDTLKITHVEPSCGCTTSDINKNIIYPGDFATVDLKLNPKYSRNISHNVRLIFSLSLFGFFDK